MTAKVRTARPTGIGIPDFQVLWYTFLGGAQMDASDDLPGSGSKSATGDYLQSWKEIAAYLGREERTVRRWEKAEGLPVRRLHHRSGDSVFALKSELEAWRARRTMPNAAPAVPATHRQRPKRLAWTALLSIPLLGAALLWFNGFEPAKTQTWATALTGNGNELEPSLSRDGMHVAFVWDGGTEKNYDVYVRDLGGREAIRLTDDAAPEYSPAWSPDGRSIAFLRQTEVSKSRLLVIDLLSRSQRTLAELETTKWPDWSRPGPHLAWSNDGKWLVAVGRLPPERIDRLLRMPAEGGQPQPITSPPPSSQGDYTPALSANGNFLAFSRRLSWSNSVLCLMPVSRDLEVVGAPTQIESDAAWNVSPAWIPDRQEIVFSSGRMDATYLARVHVSKPSHVTRLSAAGAYGWQPSLARGRSGRIDMVYTEHFESVNIWRQRLAGGGQSIPLITSPHWSYEPDYSPDGRRIAFISDRSGFAEIWVADADGRNTQQWTFLKQPSLGSPKWSPEATRIAFSVPGADGSSIVTVGAAGSRPELVPGSHKCGYFTWSHDGRTIYFTSNRSGSTQIWKIGLKGGDAVQVTDTGGRIPAVSPDGNTLYYLRIASDGVNRLFRRGLDPSHETEVLSFVDAYSPTKDGIAFKYYRPGTVDQGPFLAFFEFARHSWIPLLNSPQPLRYGIASSPDGVYVLYSQADHSVSEIKVLRDLR
jgi:Tol biopolymer transport system component